MLLDGAETKDYTLNAGKDALTVPGLDPTKKAKIEIIYRFK